MFQDTPLSAYLLCYGPLAVTIIGFLIFAGMTDSNARRTYLRRDPNLSADELPAITSRVDAETPSGVKVTIEPDPEPEPSPAVPAPDAPSPN